MNQIIAFYKTWEYYHLTMAEQHIFGLEGAKLIEWRNRQFNKYMGSGLNREQAAELVAYVESPVGSSTTERVNTLARMAIDGGLLDSLKSNTEI